MCPQFCECAGSPFVGSDLRVVSLSSVYHCRSSCPEKAHGELPFTAFSVPFPVISPAKAALALAPAMATAQNAPANIDLFRSMVSPLFDSPRVAARTLLRAEVSRNRLARHRSCAPGRAGALLQRRRTGSRAIGAGLR